MHIRWLPGDHDIPLCSPRMATHGLWTHVLHHVVLRIADDCFLCCWSCSFRTVVLYTVEVAWDMDGIGTNGCTTPYILPGTTLEQPNTSSKNTTHSMTPLIFLEERKLNKLSTATELLWEKMNVLFYELSRTKSCDLDTMWNRSKDGCNYSSVLWKTTMLDRSK